MAYIKKYATKFPGVRYYEGPDRPKHRGKPDRYYSIRLRVEGKLKEEGLGWASEGWTPDKASLELARLREARITGKGPNTLGEERRLKRQEAEARRAQEERARLRNLTFAEIWALYYPQAQENKTEGSCEREEGLYRLWLAPVLKKLPLVEIRPFHLERVKKNMRTAGRHDRTICYALAVTRQMFNFARRNRLFDGDPPTKEVKFPNSDNRRLRFLTVEEVARLLSNLAIRNPEVRDMALLSVDCGLRKGEILGLTWADVDLAGGFLTLRNTKNGRSRMAFPTKRAKAMLTRRAGASKAELVFPGSDYARVQAIKRAFGSAMEALEFNEGITDPRQKVVFHSLRHTYASRLAENGVSLYTIKELMGHCTLAMTERYAHLSEDTLRKSVSVLDATHTVSLGIVDVASQA